MRCWLAAMVVALVLVVPTQTWAECAWVMWEQSLRRTYREVEDPARRWDLVAAFDSRRDCQDAVDRILQQAARERFEMAGRAVCLPDTIDPRVPKGGGR